MGQVWSHSQSWMHLGSAILGVSALNRLTTHTLHPGIQNLRGEIQLLTSLSCPKCPGKILPAPLSQPAPSVPHTDSCSGWGSSPSGVQLPNALLTCFIQRAKIKIPVLCAREEKPTQAAWIPSATNRQKREAEQKQMENENSLKKKEKCHYIP